MKKIIILLALPPALAGCTSIVNLTPSRMERSPDGNYRVEAAWKSSEQAIRPESIKPLVVVGFDTYPMRPEPVVSDRWEAFVPVPTTEKLLHYKFKFDFMRNAVSAPQPDSRMTADFSLQIVDKPK